MFCLNNASALRAAFKQYVPDSLMLEGRACNTIGHHDVAAASSFRAATQDLISAAMAVEFGHDKLSPKILRFYIMSDKYIPGGSKIEITAPNGS